jgi:hypothetical protein
MRFLIITLTLVLVGASVIGLSGCMSDVGRPLVQHFESGFSLAVWCGAFRSQHQRWPRDYAELSAFMQQAGEKSQLDHFDSIALTNLADGRLDVRTVSDGTTNEMTLSVSQAERK